jgi:hypothetical protein
MLHALWLPEITIRQGQVSRRLCNWACFGCLLPDAVLRLLRRRRESSLSRVGSLQGYETDWREQRNDYQGEDSTSHSSLPRAILHQDGRGTHSVYTGQCLVGTRHMDFKFRSTPLTKWNNFPVYLCSNSVR